jgi:hypothetical protein
LASSKFNSLTVPALMIWVMSRETILPGCGSLADRDAPAGFDQLRNVTWGRVIRHAAHRHFVPLGQRDIQQYRRFLRVFEKQFVKIAQSKKQERVRRDAFPQSLILLHHGGKRILHRSSLQSVKVNCEFVMVSPEISCLFDSVRVQLAG